MLVEIPVGDKQHQVVIDNDAQELHYENKSESYAIHKASSDSYFIRIGTRTFQIDGVKIEDNTVRFHLNGDWYQIPYLDERNQLLNRLGIKSSAESKQSIIKSPMPGKILDIRVHLGDTIQKGDPVIILEAMKMENELKSLLSGVVKTIAVEIGESVEKNHTLIELE